MSKQRGPSDQELRDQSPLWLASGDIDPTHAPDFSDCVLPYTQFHHDNFLGGTRGMTPIEGWAYTIMLMEMYSRGAPLDIPISRLARLCGTTPTNFKKALEVLIEDGKVIQLDCGLWNERVHLTYMRRAIQQGINRSAGLQSGKKRKKNKGPIERTFDDRSTTDEPSSEVQNNIKDTNVSFLPENDPPPEPEKKMPKRKSRIREDAEISDSMLAAADKRGHSKQEAEAQFQRFKNDALAKGKQFVDWDRAYVTWLDSEYFRPITSTNGQTAASGEVPEQNYELWASAIKENKDYLIRNISRQRIGEMIDRGFITEDLARERRLI